MLGASLNNLTKRVRITNHFSAWARDCISWAGKQNQCQNYFERIFLVKWIWNDKYADLYSRK